MRDSRISNDDQVYMLVPDNVPQNWPQSTTRASTFIILAKSFLGLIKHSALPKRTPSSTSRRQVRWRWQGNYLFPYFFLASPAFVCKISNTNKIEYMVSYWRNWMNVGNGGQILTFFTPRIFFDLFFLSFICLRDFSTLVARPFCKGTQDISKNIITNKY